MIVVDSSFLISYYMPEDENHQKALELFEKNQWEEWALLDFILYESLTVLNYRRGIEFAKRCHEELLGSRQISLLRLNENEQEEALSEFFASSGKLSTADSMVVYLAKKTGASVLAFDAGINKALTKK